MREVPAETIEYANRAKREFVEELKREFRDWIDEFRMDRHPDGEYTPFDDEYLQALREAVDHLEVEYGEDK